MAYQAIPPGSSGIAILSRARALVPSANFDTVIGLGDFDSSAGWVSTGSTGTVTQSVTAKGGVVTLDTTTTSGRFARVFPAGGSSYIDNARTSPWYYYGVMAVSAGDAQAIMRLTMVAISAGAPANPAIGIGMTGSISTTNFSWALVDAGGATTASGTGAALDTNYHVFEIANNTTTIAFYLDGVSMGSSAVANIGATPMMPGPVVVNGTTAASRTMSLDKQFFVCRSNAP